MVYANLYSSNLKIKYVDICSFVNMLGTDFVIFQRILSSLPICYVNICLFDQNVVNSTVLYMRNMYSSNLIDLYVDLCHDIRQMVPKLNFCRIQFCHSTTNYVHGLISHYACFRATTRGHRTYP